jgi:hypothetical protein
MALDTDVVLPAAGVSSPSLSVLTGLSSVTGLSSLMPQSSPSISTASVPDGDILICVSKYSVPPIHWLIDLSVPSTLYTTTKIVVVSTTTTTYTYTPMPLSIKDTANAAFTVAQGSPPAPQRLTAQKPASHPSDSIYPDITDLQLNFPMWENMCSLAESTHALQGPSTQATGLLKNPQLPLVPEELGGLPIFVFFSPPDPSSSKLTQTTHSSLKPLW